MTLNMKIEICYINLVYPDALSDLVKKKTGYTLVHVL